MAGKKEYVDVSPAVLRWARESAGCTEADLARAAGVDVQRVHDWAAGVAGPTIAQLREVAERVKRPLSVLLLESPPDEPPPVHDFRQLAHYPSGYQGDTRALRLALRRLRHEQAELAEILVRPGRWATELPRLSLGQKVDVAGQRLRSALGVTFQEQTRAADAGAFRLWRGRTEALSIFVQTLAGIDVTEMRGVVLPHQVAPFIAVNNADAPSARVFTLAHELAHLSLFEEGLCDTQDDGPNEKWCNAVAGALLVPEKDLLSYPAVAGASQWGDDEVRSIARSFGVSRQVILRRLWDLRKVSQQFYVATMARWENEARTQRSVEKEAREGGPTFYRTKVAHLGRGLISTVLEALHDQRVTTSRACDILGVKAGKLQRLEDEVFS